jgi:hypothetical protein
MKRWIGLLASVAFLGVTGGARAQDVANLERNIQRAEQTLSHQPHLAQYCAQLKTGDFFFHRGRHNAGKPPVVSLAAWEMRIKQETAAGRMAPDRADNLVQAAKRLRSEQHNACNLDHWKAELARLQRPKVLGSAEAEFAWNREADGFRVIGGKGMLTGDLSSWRFTGQVPASWNGALRINVTCEGRLDPGVSPKPGAKGSMECRATWTETGQRHEWRCRGDGGSRVVWSIGDHWFGIWPNQCVGTIVANNKTSKQAFGLVSLKSKLGLE